MEALKFRAVIPAKAGIYALCKSTIIKARILKFYHDIPLFFTITLWIPAFAGMTPKALAAFPMLHKLVVTKCFFKFFMTDF